MSLKADSLKGLDLWSMIQTREIPSMLYQYTDIDAFQGIIEKNEIWATHWCYLNDKNELKYGIKLIQKGIEFCRKKAYSEDTNKFLASIEEMLCKSPMSFPLNIDNLYVVSLTTQKDLLSQWRGYGRKYKSVCIGFSTKQMKFPDPVLDWSNATVSWEDKKNIYRLRKIIYKKNDQEAIAIASVKFACDEIEKELKNGRLEKTNEIRLHDFFNMVTPGLLCVKEPCWKEEKEWRIIVQPKKREEENEVRFRKNDYGLVPYIPINFSKTTMMDAIYTIYIPRSDRYHASKKGIELYWNSMKNGKKQKCDHDIIVKKSTISIIY